MKVNKYDRQIRLWGHNGQKKLSQAKVALLGSTGAGVQALKNLVLPGIGHVDIWAEGNVTQQDLATCFFFSPQDIGKPKAESLLSNLLQMNPDDVQGTPYNQNPQTLLKDTLKLKDYTLIICSNLKEALNKQISQQCYKFDIPVVFITVVGFYIYVRNQRSTHIVEAENSASKKYYMRLHDPFQGLREYSQQWNIQLLISTLSKSENDEQKSVIRKSLSCIPYPIVLQQIYENLPLGSRSKAKVLEKIKQYSILIGENDRQTFTEASNRTLDLYQTPDNFLPDVSIFQNQQVLTATSNSSHSLQFLRACGHFYSHQKHLPQGTKLPDMHTSTKTYLQLKKVYKNQHEIDITQIQEILHNLIGDCLLSRDQISNFIDNLEALGIIHLGIYKQQLQKIDNPNLKWQAPEWRNILVALRAYKIFEDIEGRSPTPADILQVKAISESLKHQYGLQDSIDHKYSEQVCRAEGKTMISINSIAGAVAGQQAIKLITNCFTPVKSGYIYSGVHSIGYSVAL